jgi:homoserine O-succinyltransferase
MSSVDQRVAKRCSESGVVRIGLVNNMPPGACSTTERQFTQILAEAGSDYAVELQCFRTFRSGAGTELSPMEAIRGANLDGMIVTGAEPQSLSLRSEPIWPLITRLVDLGYERDLPIMWSCLAAHAAILYLDGIDRVRLDYKMSGLFAGAAIAPDHPLLEGFLSARTEQVWIFLRKYPNRALYSCRVIQSMTLTACGAKSTGM